MRQNHDTLQMLSNEDFKRQLSFHGADSNGNDEMANGAAHVISDDEDDIKNSVHDATPAEFTSKLERLIAVRHRRFEKEHEKDAMIRRERQARQARAAEAETRARQLSRHEMEWDVKEIEASLTPRALSRRYLVGTATTTKTTTKSKGKGTSTSSSTASSGQPQAQEHQQGRRGSHRVTVSDSDYNFSTDPSIVGQSSIIELGTISGGNGGPSMRLDHDDSSRPPRSHARNLSDSVHTTNSPRKRQPHFLATDAPAHNATRVAALVTPAREQPHPLKMQSARHRRSHRRSFSHGTAVMEEKKTSDAHSSDGRGHQRSGSNASAQDVMEFGIAAYAPGFV